MPVESTLPSARDLTSTEAKTTFSLLRQMAQVIRTRGVDISEDAAVDEVQDRLMKDALKFAEAATDPSQFDSVFVGQLWAQVGLREKLSQAMQSTAKIQSPGEKVVSQAAVATYMWYTITSDPYWRQTYDKPGGWNQLRDEVLNKAPAKKRQAYQHSRLHSMKPEDFKHMAWDGLATSQIRFYGSDEYDKWKEFIFLIT